MIGAKQLSQMKSTAVMINVARGTVIRETDLVAALRDGTIAAAGLDVVEQEPLPSDSPLWEMANVLITPHVAAQGHDRLDQTTRFFCKNLVRFLSGRPLLNVVDRELGFSLPDTTG
jgi:phosphoglycerate dehydrogenase-like enzyme